MLIINRRDRITQIRETPGHVSSHSSHSDKSNGYFFHRADFGGNSPHVQLEVSRAILASTKSSFTTFVMRLRRGRATNSQNTTSPASSRTTWLWNLAQCDQFWSKKLEKFNHE
jgi:hypothetical protein